MRNKIRNLLHKEDPYKGFFPAHEIDLHGWGGHSEVFFETIETIKPETIVEVGSWKGLSASVMAKKIQEMNLDCELVCVDTWLGATEFWENHNDKNRYESLNLQNGYPSVYYQFLTNMKELGLSEIVTPFPQTSTNAARFFKRKNLSAQLIWIDASHEFEDVLQDISSWWEVLDVGGIMFGDDYCEYWSGVIDAVNMFAENHDLEIETASYKNDAGRPNSDYWFFSPKKF